MDEGKYEWGNMENGLLKDKEGMEFKLASAARKWRNGSIGGLYSTCQRTRKGLSQGKNYVLQPSLAMFQR